MSIDLSKDKTQIVIKINETNTAHGERIASRRISLGRHIKIDVHIIRVVY